MRRKPLRACGPAARWTRGGLTGLLLLAAAALWAEAPDPGEILRRVDATMSAWKDQEMTATLILVERGGGKRERTLQIFQKGPDRRLARFLTPADQKGIGVLTLPDGSIYLYLPAYRKVRRIAGHVRNSSFAGTDFSYADMEARQYARHYDAVLLDGAGDRWRLELTPRPSADTAYSRLRVEVRKDNAFPVLIEYYDAQGNAAKRLTSRSIERIGGYWIAREMEMEDLRSGHRTRLLVQEVRFDTGVADGFFSQRTLER